MRIISIIFSVIIIASACLHAGDYIRLGSTSAPANTDDFDLVFYIERTCPSPPNYITEASNPFIITAIGNATYQFDSVYQDPGSSVNWDLGFYTYEAMDGIFPDTICVEGRGMMEGIPIISDEPYFHMILDIGPGTGMLCFDSATTTHCSWVWWYMYCGEGGSDRPYFVDKYGSDLNHPICIAIYEEEEEPALCGDTNCDGSVNVADAVWIINYVFVGGKGPCDTSGDGVQDCY